MLPGYNAPRPKAENYKDFLEKLVKGLEPLGNEGLSLLVYGSYIRGDYTPGRSDIDAALTFPDHVVIDKDRLQKAALVIAQAQKGNNISFQVTPTDRTTMRDGTFNSFNPSFATYFKKEGNVLVGPDYRGEWTFSLPQYPNQIEITFNLRKARQGLLLALHEQATDYELFLRRFTKSLDAITSATKQILFLIDGEVRKNRFSTIHEVEEKFPSVDTEPLEEIKSLYETPEKLDRLYRRPNTVMDLWNASVTFLEEIIKSYLINKSAVSTETTK